MLKQLPALIAAAISYIFSPAQAAETSTTYASIYQVPVEPMKADGGTSVTSLSAYKGEVLLIVNVASKCGFTKQYTGLEELNDKYKDKGLRLLGFPSDDFGGQEPGTEEEIVQFCKSKYDVSFPLFAKVKAKGTDRSPIYEYLTMGDHPARSEVAWNFNKFLIGRDGKPVAHFASKIKPDDAELVSAIEKELAKPRP